MKQRIIALGLFAALSLVGCAAPTPVAQNFPLTYQKVARTAQHWSVMADDVVAQTAKYLASNQALQGRGVFVPASSKNSAFDATFRDFLIDRLVDRGMQVSVCAAPPRGTGFATSPDVYVKYETRIIGHSELPYYRPGVLTALAAGVFVGRSIANSDLSYDARGLAGVAVAGLVDLAIANMPRPTRTEIVVTTSIEEGNRFLMRRSDIYYVPDYEADLFIQRVAHNPLCPSEQVAASATNDIAAADDAQYRRQWFANEMRRINPEWRPPSAQSFSY